MPGCPDKRRGRRQGADIPRNDISAAIRQICDDENAAKATIGQAIDAQST